MSSEIESFFYGIINIKRIQGSIMRHKLCYCLCGVIIIASVIIGIYNKFVLSPLRAQTYVISTWEIIYFCVAKPAIWTCAGILGSLSLFRLQIKHQLREASLWIGIVLIALYCGILLLSFVKTSTITLPWLLNHSLVFLIPGILVGLGLNKKVP